MGRKFHHRELIANDRLKTLTVDWVPNSNPSAYTYCRQQLATGRERQVAHVEAFPISHNLSSPGSISNATSEFGNRFLS